MPKLTVPTAPTVEAIPPVVKKKQLKPADDQREMRYPTIQVCGVDVPEEKLIVTPAKAKLLMDWESEPEYTSRMLAENCTLKADMALFKDKVQTFLVDEEGHRVTCWNNDRNREFDPVWSRKLAQDMLNGEFEFNGETVVISRTGQVTSGQHRLAALILADQILQSGKSHRLAERWPDGISIKTLVVTGGSDDPRVLRTVDQTKPRSLSDVISTSPLFMAMDPATKKECCRMLQAAVDLFWRRSGAADEEHGRIPGGRSPKKLQTNAASMEFLDNHPRLVDAVVHVQGENAKKRPISVLGISAGHTAALMYLMAASEDDVDAYRLGMPRSEESLSLELWEQAKEFVILLCGGINATAVRPAFQEAMAKLQNFSGQEVDGVQQAQDNVSAKHALICKAWHAWRENQIVTEEDLVLDVGVGANGLPCLLTKPDFGGIDAGDKPDKLDDDKVPAKEVEQAKKADRKKIDEEVKAKLEAAKAAKAQADFAAAKEKEERRKAEAAMKAASAPKINPAKMSDAEKKKMAADQAAALKAANAKKAAKK